MTKRISVVIPLLLALVAALAIPGGAVTAQDVGEVIVDGLNAPQGVLVDSDGAVYVVDAGVGGDTEVETVSPEGETIVATVGETSQIVRVDPDGTQTVVANLPSILLGDEALGGGKLAMLDGELYVTSGGYIEAGPDTPEPMEYTAAVLRVGEDGSLEEVAPTWRVEKRMNADDTIIESHPYGIAAGPDGKLWVADAGANTLLRVDPATGSVEVLTVFAPLPGVFPNPLRGGEMLTDPVPTGITFDDEGNAIVSLLSGAPFVPGSTKVMKVGNMGATSEYATGLTMLTDIARGPDGEFYGVQFAVFTDQGPTPNSGAIVHIVEGEGSEPVLEGLSFPTSLAFNEAGDAYIAINGAGPPGAGAVIKVAGLAGGEMAAEAEAAATPEATEEPAEEATPEATEEPAEEATPEPTEEMAEEATPEATEEVAEEATAEPTEEPVEEATPEPTEEATEEATPEPTDEPAEEAATPEPTDEMTEEAGSEDAGPAAGSEDDEEEMALMDIVDTAAGNDDFSTLVAAIQAAGLVDALKSEGPFTVFAPTNEAFEALPEGTLESLLADPTGELTDILLYHVVPGEALAADITDGLEVTTLQGDALTFSVDGETVMVDDATILATDIEASNGVIHVIDSVLLPGADEAVGGAAGAGEEATPEPTEEVAEEATPEPTEEMAEEATPEPTEEMAEEMAEEATPEATEEMAEEDMGDEGMDAPETLPDTGAEQPGALPIVLLVLGVVVAVAGGTFMRRRLA